MPRKRPDSRLVILAGGNSNVREEAEAHPYDPNGPGAPRLTGMPPAGMRRSANAIPSTGSATAQQSVAMTPIYYDYRFSTPDKYYFPKDRFNANATWRDIYRRDATIAIATDLYAELPWSEFDIEKINDHKIRQIYEDMFTDLDLVSNLPAYTKDFLITGELIMHSLFNKKKGYWDRAISHSADYVRIVGTGLAAEQPLMWLRVTPEFQKMLALSSDPIVRKYLSSIPASIIRAFKENKEVHLDPLNTTFIPRINTSQDIRGTSIYTRLFRINMYEDFVMNASLSIAQRNAAPLRLFKVGDVSRPDGWIPNADDIQALSDLLSISETDPFAALITHPYITVDYVGVSDKVLLISREWEFIERVKLLGLGISKAFLMGETSFSCFEEGTQVIRSNGTPDAIENIKNGDLVLDQNGKSSKVVNNWCEGVPEKLVEVEVWGGRKFRVTPNHRFPAWVWPTKCYCGCGGDVENVGRMYIQNHMLPPYKNVGTVPCEARVHEGRHPISVIPVGYEPNQIVQAGNLRKGDFLKIPKTHDVVCTPENVNADVARLLGYYLSEGNINYYKKTQKIKYDRPCSMRLTFGLHERNTWVKDVEEIGARLGMRVTVNRVMCHGKPRNAWCVDVIPKDKSFLNWVIFNAGKLAHGKTLSDEVMRWPVELQHELIRGYFRGDGSRKSKPAPAMHAKTLAIVQVGTVSKNLATQMVLLLARLGFQAGHAVANCKPPRHKYHILRIGGDSAVRLCKLVWSEDMDVNTCKCMSWQDDNYIYAQIRSVKEVPNTKPVYNLEVEGSHTYLVCDGLATHNSAVAGLQVLLERLNSLRQLITNKWIINKLCQTVAEMNDFHEVSQSELANRIRIKKKTERRLIVPNLKWRKSLQPTEDQSLMSTWRDFKEKGLISDRTYLGGGGVDIEVERRNLIEEGKYQQELQERGLTPPAEGEEPGGGGGGSLLAPPPPEGGELGASKLRAAAAKIFANPYCNGDEIDTGPRMSMDQAVDKLKRMNPKERKQILEHIHRKVRRPNPALLSGRKTN